MPNYKRMRNSYGRSPSDKTAESSLVKRKRGRGKKNLYTLEKENRRIKVNGDPFQWKGRNGKLGARKGIPPGDSITNSNNWI